MSDIVMEPGLDIDEMIEFHKNPQNFMTPHEYLQYGYFEEKAKPIYDEIMKLSDEQAKAIKSKNLKLQQTILDKKALLEQEKLFLRKSLGMPPNDNPYVKRGRKFRELYEKKIKEEGFPAYDSELEERAVPVGTPITKKQSKDLEMKLLGYA